jgi:hypothetical protein
VQSGLKIDTTNGIIETVREAKEKAGETVKEDNDLEEEDKEDAEEGKDRRLGPVLKAEACQSTKARREGLCTKVGPAGPTTRRSAGLASHSDTTPARLIVKQLLVIHLQTEASHRPWPWPWPCRENLQFLVQEFHGLCFFHSWKNRDSRVLETHLEGLKAACFGPALSKFRPSVRDGATYCTSLPDPPAVPGLACSCRMGFCCLLFMSRSNNTMSLCH